MSFNRLNYDICQYQQSITESTGPGHYQLNTPPISCEPCYPTDVQQRLQHSGASVDTSRPMIDIDSEMLNITRPSSKCPSRKWVPICEKYSAPGYPCGQGVVPTCQTCDPQSKVKAGDKCPDQFSSNLTHWKDCSIPIEDTRLSNPPCNLRGTGLNRWEWLCLNPQDRIEIPFDYNISNRIVVKDNHRPCVPNPLNQVPALPKGGPLPCEKINSTCAAPTNPPSVQWQNCDNLSVY
jgi:hypothetical protein